MAGWRRNNARGEPRSGGPACHPRGDWHGDDERDLGRRAPFLVTGTVGPDKETIGCEGYFLMSGEWLMRWNRAWPGGSKSNPYTEMPDYMDVDSVYVVDFDWKAYVLLQDMRGSVRAVPLVLDRRDGESEWPRVFDAIDTELSLRPAPRC